LGGIIDHEEPHSAYSVLGGAAALVIIAASGTEGTVAAGKAAFQDYSRYSGENQGGRRHPC
jgi:hypothetical protein